MCGAHIKLKRVSGVQDHESVSIFLVVSPFCKVCVSPHNFFLFQQELSLYGLLRHWWMINLSHAPPLPPPPPSTTATATTTIMVATREWCGRPLFSFLPQLSSVSSFTTKFPFMLCFPCPLFPILKLKHVILKPYHHYHLFCHHPIKMFPNKLLLQRYLF